MWNLSHLTGRLYRCRSKASRVKIGGLRVNSVSIRSSRGNASLPSSVRPPTRVAANPCPMIRGGLDEQESPNFVYKPL